MRFLRLSEDLIMKKLSLLPILLLSLLSTSCWGVDWDDLVERDGIYYEKFSDTPYTGKVNGEEKGKLKEGKKNGRWIAYHDNGKKKLKGVCGISKIGLNNKVKYIIGDTAPQRP